MVAKKATNFEWEIENQLEVRRLLDNLASKVKDLRIPFRLIASDFYRSNRKLFTLQGSGLYQDLAPATGMMGNPTTKSNYKEQKKRMLGFAYPILVGATRALSNSILGRSNKYSHFVIDNQNLEMGTTVPHGKYHQSDKLRKKIPLRKFVFIDGGPADKSKDASISGRRERWTNIINTHIKQVVEGKI